MLGPIDPAKAPPHCDHPSEGASYSRSMHSATVSALSPSHGGKESPTTTPTQNPYSVRSNTGLTTPTGRLPAKRSPANRDQHLWIGTTTDNAIAASNSLRPISTTTEMLGRFSVTALSSTKRHANDTRDGGYDRRAAGINRRWSELTRHRIQRTQKPLPWQWPLDQRQRRHLSRQSPTVSVVLTRQSDSGAGGVKGN